MSGDPKKLLKAILRQNLTAFVEKTFQTVSPGDEYLPNWHIEAITHHLETCLTGDCSRLIITQPPRSLKSICSSVALVAWALGHNPTRRFICVSYSQDLAIELARQFRVVVESDWYKELFPGMRLRRSTEIECVTTCGGGRLATSVGGTLTGRGADVIIIDDPLKASDAQSEPSRRAVIDWYRSSLVSRLDDKQKGVIVLVMQRLHEEDLAGHLLTNTGWKHLDLPAIADEDQLVSIGPELEDMHRRVRGDVLHPERESKADLDRLKAELSSLTFSAQYQQRPVPIEGNLVRRSWLKTYDSLPDGPRATTIQSWDVAGSVGERNDYSVCTTWGIHEKRFYLVDVWRDRLKYPDLRRQVIKLSERFNPATILIEKAGLGLNLVQDLRQDSPTGMPLPIGVNPEGSKIDRMQAQTAKFENGQVLLPKDAPWRADFESELLGFPNARYDDQVDSVSQALNWYRRTREPPLLVVSGEKAPAISSSRLITSW